MRISPLFVVFFMLSSLTLIVCIALIGVLLAENNASQDTQALQDSAAPEMTGAFSLTSVEPQAPATEETQPAVTPTVHISSAHVTHSSSESSSTSSSTTSNSEDEADISEPDTPAQDDCLGEYELSPRTIIFYYTDEPHSNAMKTIAQELQAEYTFYWTASLWDSKFNSCFGTSGATPAFVCAGTKEKIVGQVSKSLLEDFAEGCA